MVRETARYTYKQKCSNKEVEAGANGEKEGLRVKKSQAKI
jgi:hypothetical protein